MVVGKWIVSGARLAESAIGAVCTVLLVVTGLGLLCLLTLVATLRYVFQTGLNFAPDLSELLFAIFVMAGIVQAARMGAHVATQLLLQALAPFWRRVLAVLIHALTAGVYLLLAWYAYQNALIAHDQTTPVLNIPWSVGYGCLALGLALVAVCSLAALIRHTLGGEPVAVNVAEPGTSAT